MGTLNSWQVVDANNNATPPDGWPENTMNYSDVNNTGRAVQGTMKRFFADVNGSLDAGGAADAYTLTLNEVGYTAYFDGMWFACSIPATNLTTTPTIDVNGIGAANIVDRLGNAVSIGELMSGGIYDFRYDGTNFRLLGSGDVAGLDGQVQYNNGGAFGGAAGMTYNDGNNQITLTNPVNVNTDIVLSEQADHSSTPGASFGYIWVRDDNPTALVFTNSDGIDVTLGSIGSTPPGGVDGAMQYNNGGNLGGMAEWNYDDVAEVLTVTSDATGSISGSPFQMVCDDLTAGYALWIDVGGAGNLSVGGAILAIGDTGGGSLNFGGTIQAISRNASPAVRIDSQFADGYGLYVESDVTGRNEPLAYINQDFAATNVEALRLQQDGDQPHINLIGLNGKGIRFGATNKQSTDPNVLDDYEEMDYTTDWNPGGGGSSGTITLNGGVDTLGVVKIGSLVFIQGFIQVGSVSSPVGDLRMDIPYTTSALLSNFANNGLAFCKFIGSWGFSTNEYGNIAIGANDDYVTIERLNDGSIANFCAAGAGCSFSFCYITDE